MSKSISKKILLFLLIVVASLCFSLSSIANQRAFAAQVGFENTYDTGARVDSEDDIETRRNEILEGIAFYKDALPDDVVLVDEGDEALDLVKSRIENHYGDYDSVSKSLYGNSGLNGLLGIYEVAYNFYNTYVLVDGNGYTQIAVDNDFPASVNSILLANATEYLSEFNAKKFENGDGSDSELYDKTRADAWAQAFVDDANKGLAHAISLNTELATKCDGYLAQIDYYRSYYFSEKFGSAYVNETIYESATDVSEEKAELVKDGILDVFANATDYDKALADMEKAVTDYVATFKDVKTALARAYEEVLARADLNAENPATTEEVLTLCETVFASFETLGTIDSYVKDGEGNPIVIDLKSGHPVGVDKDTGDLKLVGNLLREYITATKRAIDENSADIGDEYGISANKVSGDLIKYAKGMADCLIGYGKLAGEGEEAPTVGGISATQYTYVDGEGNAVKVVTGSDIVKALIDSFTVDGALVLTYNGSHVSTTALSAYKKISTLTYTPEGENPAYTITLTCVDEDGNEVNYFDVAAKLVVREGATPSIERNLYLILKGSKAENATKGLDAEVAKSLEKRVLLYYFTFTVSELQTTGGSYKVLEMDAPISVNITVDFKDKDQLTAIKEKTLAFSYCHTTVNEVYNDIQWGDTTMTFKVSNFLNEAQIAMANTADAPIDWVAILIYGLVGLVAALFLIWLIIVIIKNWKYKVVFYARGGKYNKCIKVKVHEKFNHPAAPKRRGYHFLGWYKDKKCTIKFADSELVKRGNVKVYAKWMANAEYERLEEMYESDNSGFGVPVIIGAPASAEAPVVAPVAAADKKDPQIEKIEAEKLGYEAKKAEEERKTEEVKLQTIREIEEAKKNEEARANAEADAANARAERDQAIADRDALIQEARADERNKTIEEMQTVNTGVAVVDYDEAIAKAKAETEEKLRKEFDEESKARAEEQAKINAELSEKIKALEEANAKALEDEARRQAEEDARIQAAIAAGVAAKLAEAQPAPVAQETPVVEEPAPVEEPAKGFDTDHVFDVLKAEIYSYTDADDLGYGLEASVPACAMKVVGETIELQVNLDASDCAKKGYKVTAGDVLPVKFVLASDDDIDEAEELIEETMLENGLKKTKKAVITEATAETRAQGFEHGVSKDRVADTPEEFYKLLRVYAKSFVLADDSDVEEKVLLKMFLARGRVFMYLAADGANACDDELASQGFKSIMTVKTVDDCKAAIKAISAMMKENGLIRYPSEVKIADDDSLKGFTYTLSK